MARSIDELKANISEGFALADRFEIQLPPLTSLIPSSRTNNILNILTGAEPVQLPLADAVRNTINNAQNIGMVDPVLQRVGYDTHTLGIFDPAGLARRALDLNIPFGPKFDFDPQRRVALLCTGVNMPGRQITTTDRTIGMVTQQMPGGFVEDDVSMTFRLDQNYTAFTYFYLWQNAIIGTDFHEVSYKSEYARDITISQMKKHAGGLEGLAVNTPIYKIKLIDAFPKSIQSIPLADASQDTIVEMTVDISYTRWTTA